LEIPSENQLSPGFGVVDGRHFHGIMAFPGA
jgi:hypothetical protein